LSANSGCEEKDNSIALLKYASELGRLEGVQLTVVAPGPASEELGRRVAQELGARLVSVESKLFPDGESYIRYVGEVRGEPVIVVQSCGPPQNRSVIELLLMLDTARNLGAEMVVAVVPYLAYARQDKRFRPGEGISVETIVKLIECSGASRFITFDIHKEETLKRFRIPALNLSAMPVIAEYFAKLELRRPLIVSPDIGALHLAAALSERIGAEYTSFEKKRDRVGGAVTTIAKSLDAKGRDVVIVDDIISTGSTIVNAAQLVRKEAVRDIFAACTHALLTQDARTKICQSGIKEIVGTDCVASEVSVVSVAYLVAEALRKFMC